MAGLLDTVLPLGISLVAIWISWEALGISRRSKEISEDSGRFNFLAANRDLMDSRREIQQDPGRINWATWSGKEACTRAKEVSEYASNSQREDFLANLAGLVSFTFQYGTPTFENVQHLLLCCREVNEFPEREGVRGQQIVSTFEPYLGQKNPGEGFQDYLGPRRQALSGLQDDHEPVYQKARYRKDILDAYLDMIREEE